MAATSYKLYISLALFFTSLINVAYAHEYWIEPRIFEIAPGETIEADLRNGQNFKGNQLYYLTHRFVKFEVHSGETIHKITGANGDQPALKFKSNIDGLHILIYQSVFDNLTFDKWEKFVAYTKNQGLNNIVAEHKSRGLSQTSFNESYARTIKALVSVGGGKGSDRRTGLPFEFVAQDNPYTMAIDPDKEQFLKVRLFLDEKWLANKQVLIFQNNGKITQSKAHTDALGFANIPVKGGGKFMLSAVHMFEGDDDPETKRAEWISLWANLTFALPGADAMLKKPDEN